MATADRIERERQAKRTLILEAARELFLERGYEAVTLREIAQRIEHSTTAVYVHFKDKRDLMEQMVAEDFGKFAAALQAQAEVRPASARLGQLGVAYIQFALTLPRHYQLLFLTPSPADAKDVSSSENEPGFSSYSQLVDTVREAMDEGFFRPELTDPVAVAQAVWAAMHGLVSLLIIMGDVAFFQWRKPEVLVEVLMGSLMRGLARDAQGTMNAAQLALGDVAARATAGCAPAKPAKPAKPAAPAADEPTAAPTRRARGKGTRTAR